MQPSRRNLAYSSRISVFQYLPYGRRLYLSKFVKDLPNAVRQNKYRLNSLKADLIEKRYGAGLIVDAGSIRVDSVEYTFQFVPDSVTRGRMEITCSLRPDKTVSVPCPVWSGYKSGIVEHYFEYFMQLSPQPVRNLEIGSIQSYLGLGNLKTPLLKWKLLWPTTSFNFLDFFPRTHVFERLEMEGQAFEYLIQQNRMRNAKHLILNRRRPSGSEETVVADYLLQNPPLEMLESTQHLSFQETFLKCCEIILKEKIKVGSSITGIYYAEMSIKNEMFEKVMERFKDFAVEGPVIVLAKDGFITTVSHDGTESETRKHTFTVTKLCP